MIELKNISVGFKEELFTSKELVLSKGSMIVLVGPNGSGKTTLFNTILGQVQPLAGQITVNGRDINSLKIHDRSSLIGFVPSRFTGVDHLSVRELIAMGRAPYTNMLNRLKPEDHEIIDRVIQELELEHIQFKSSTEISDGERQIAMIGKVLAQKTSVILLDEPTAFLDYSNRNKVLKLLKELSERDDKLIIVSSHDIELCLKYADKVLAINKDEKRMMTFAPPYDNEKLIDQIFE
mgnify:CR=1 FL=1|tara:strand:+ start:15342 stop:16049 length:708 start_codon:yes stop_codon:yes gene_type:complete